MKTNDYLKELKKHLSALDHEKRKEILQEIESYIQESKVDYSLLVERFGTPEELAHSYLEDIPIKNSKGKNIWSKTKKIVFTIVIFLIVVFLITAVIIYNIIQDPFDYSKYNASNIDEKIEVPWKEIKDIDSLNIEQARVVIYWSDNNDFKASCQGNKSEKENSTFIIKQGECFLKVPNKKINIKSYQAKVIVVEPKNQIEFNSKQSRIKIAEKQLSYNYKLKGNQSDFKELKSDKNGILIKGNFYQSKISTYNY